jgi:hypothetical protein
MGAAVHDVGVLIFFMPPLSRKAAVEFPSPSGRIVVRNRLFSRFFTHGQQDTHNTSTPGDNAVETG